MFSNFERLIWMDIVNTSIKLLLFSAPAVPPPDCKSEASPTLCWISIFTILRESTTPDCFALSRTSWGCSVISFNRNIGCFNRMEFFYPRLVRFLFLKILTFHLMSNYFLHDNRLLNQFSMHHL